MALVAAFLVAAIIATRRVKGPVWALALAWLFCLAPIVFGWIDYGFFDPGSWTYALATIAALGAYIAGCGLWLALPRTPLTRPDAATAARQFAAGHAYARFAWWVGIAGAACVTADFALSGGAGLDDLAALRDSVVERTSASALAQIGSVMTWGCLYCFIFALVFQAKLRRAEFFRMLVPIAGYFLLSVFSAGRQASFQIMLVTGLAIAVVRARRTAGETSRRRSPATLFAAVAVAGLMIAYMGYVAVARNDNSIDDDKARVIVQLFDAQLSDGTDRVLSALGPGVHSAAVEGMVYFSSSIALFQKYLTIRFDGLTFGGMTFPFVFRQIQDFTGIRTGSLLNDKMARLADTGVLGAGWTTAISSYLEDFGVAGTGVFLLGLGYYSMGAWARARVSGDPNAVVVAMVALLIAVYMPLIPAISDTNIFLLWVFAAAMMALRPGGRWQAVAA
jgi:hypothetical protein